MLLIVRNLYSVCVFITNIVGDPELIRILNYYYSSSASHYHIVAPVSSTINTESRTSRLERCSGNIANSFRFNASVSCFKNNDYSGIGRKRDQLIIHRIIKIHLKLYTCKTSIPIISEAT